MHASSIITDTFSFLRLNWRSVLIWSAVFLVLSMVMTLAMRSVMMGPVATIETGTKPALPAGLLPRMVLLNFLMICTMIVLFAAAMRAALLPEEGGPGNLRLGLDEIRLAGLGLILVIGGYVAWLIAFAIVALLAIGFGAIAKPLGVLVGLAVGIPVLIAPIYVYTRLSLVGPLTLLRKKIVIGEAWRLSTGQFWPLFGTFLAIGIIALVLTIILMLLVSPQVFQMMMHFHDPAAMKQLAELQAQRAAAGFSPSLVLGWVVGALTGGLMTALQGGAVAIAARTLLEAHE